MGLALQTQGTGASSRCTGFVKHKVDGGGMRLLDAIQARQGRVARQR